MTLGSGRRGRRCSAALPPGPGLESSLEEARVQERGRSCLQSQVVHARAMDVLRLLCLKQGEGYIECQPSQKLRNQLHRFYREDKHFKFCLGQKNVQFQYQSYKVIATKLLGKF